MPAARPHLTPADEKRLHAAITAKQAADSRYQRTIVEVFSKRSPADVAEYLGVSNATLFRLVKEWRTDAS